MAYRASRLFQRYLPDVCVSRSSGVWLAGVSLASRGRTRNCTIELVVAHQATRSGPAARKPPARDVTLRMDSAR